MSRGRGVEGDLPKNRCADDWFSALEADSTAPSPAQQSPDQDDQTYNQEDLDDLKVAVELLTGRTERAEQGPRKAYFAQGTDEIVARKALVRLLRNTKPLDSLLRRQLAALFDPETEQAPFSSFDCAPVERLLIFKQRHRGAKASASLGKIEIGGAFERLVRKMSREEALEETARIYRVSTRTVEAAVAHLRAISGR